ncbi:MAG: protein jag [Solirubrobacterales bacterium]
MSDAETTAGERLPTDPVDRVGLVIGRVLDELDLEAEVKLSESPEEILAEIEGGEELGILIGRRGQTLDALQLVCYRAAFQGAGERKRVLVDAAGYRIRRRETIEEEAENAAALALRRDEAVKLEPMSASERRMAHEVLKERSDVETFSEGDDPERRVVVAPLVSE